LCYSGQNYVGLCNPRLEDAEVYWEGTIGTLLTMVGSSLTPFLSLVLTR